MKHITTVAAVLILAAILAAAAYTAGHVSGEKYVMDNAEFCTTEYYDPRDPYANRRNDGTDQTIYMILDGQIYEYGMWQG